MLKFSSKSEAFKFIDEYPSDDLKGILTHEYKVKIPFIFQSNLKTVWKYLAASQLEPTFIDYYTSMEEILDKIDDALIVQDDCKESVPFINTRKKKKGVRIGQPVSGEPKIIYNKITGNWESYVGESMIGNSVNKDHVVSKFPYFGIPLESVQHLI